jgi:hypothetical protein
VVSGDRQPTRRGRHDVVGTDRRYVIGDVVGRLLALWARTSSPR